MKMLMNTVWRPIVFVYNKTHWFTNQEAWGIFRFFAILEAVGWTLLICAIVYRRLELPQADSVISFAGHLHGMGFVFYFLFAFLTARSMGWGIRQIIIAVIAGMPPYGSIIFEQLMARRRKAQPVYVEPPKGYDE